MANTAKQMMIAIGETVSVECGGINVSCLVLDVKSSWGKNRLLVQPVAGDGQIWVEMTRISRPAQMHRSAFNVLAFSDR